MHMTKTITRLWMLIALLMVATTGYAQKVINMESSPWEGGYTLKSRMSFSGSIFKDVVGKENDSYRVFEGVLSPNEPLKIQCSASCLFGGKTKAKYKISIRIWFTKENGSEVKSPVKGGGEKTSQDKPLSVSCKIPKEATYAKATIEVKGTNGTQADPSTICHLTYKIQGRDGSQSNNSGNANTTKNGNNTKKPTETAGSITGTMERLGLKMSFSCSGVVVTQKGKPKYDEKKYFKRIDGDYYSAISHHQWKFEDKLMTVNVIGKVKAGTDMHISCKALLDKMIYCNGEYPPYTMIRCSVDGKNAREIDDPSAKISVPKDAKIIRVDFECKFYYSLTVLTTLRCQMKFDVVESLPKDKKDSHLNYVSEDNVCPECKGKFTGYYLKDDTYTNIVCTSKNQIRKKNNLPSMEGTVKTSIFIPLYENDKVVTGKYEAHINCCQLFIYHSSLIKLLSNSEAKFKSGLFYVNENNTRKQINGSHLYLRGSVYFDETKRKETGIEKHETKYAEAAGGYKYILHLSNCTVEPLGTSYVVKDDGQNSEVYLLSGAVKVANNANKSFTLQPGQASFVGKDGKINIKKFDTKKVAEKYGNKINTETSSATTVQKRYAMQRGTIKYKYAKGKQTGEIIRTFDGYGHYERVASKVKGSSATSLNIYRGEKAYKVDTKAKTVTQSKHEAINFLNITEAELSKHKLKKKGTATVAGKQCVVYGNANEDYYVWQGITLKKVINSKDGKIVSEAVSITQPTKIDANKFKVPSNYKMK